MVTVAAGIINVDMANMAAAAAVAAVGKTEIFGVNDENAHANDNYAKIESTVFYSPLTIYFRFANMADELFARDTIVCMVYRLRVICRQRTTRRTLT